MFQAYSYDIVFDNIGNSLYLQLQSDMSTIPKTRRDVCKYLNSVFQTMAEAIYIYRM